MIKEFKGEYRWLSNFAPVNIVYQGVKYRSVEHAYMSAKSTDPKWIRLCADPLVTAAEVKKKSCEIKLRTDWEQIKTQVMMECLQQKFNTELYKQKLLATGNVHIQEGNYWGDKFWGVCLKTGEGENRLGKMIMEIRQNLNKQ